MPRTCPQIDRDAGASYVELSKAIVAYTLEIDESGEAFMADYDEAGAGARAGVPEPAATPDRALSCVGRAAQPRPGLARPTRLTCYQAARVSFFMNADSRWRRSSLRALSSVVM